MKKFLIVSLFIFNRSISFLHSQRFEDVTSEVFELNSQTNFLTLGKGQSKNFVEATLPANTIGYVYRISISQKGQSNNIGNLLFTALKSVSPTSLKMGVNLAEYTIEQNDSEAIDFLILPSRQDALNFVDGNDYRHCQYLANRLNLCTTSTNCLGNRLYFAFKNNNIRQGLNVHFEVVAIVKDEIVIDGWTASRKNEIYNMFKDLLIDKLCSNLSENEKFLLASCSTKKLTHEYTDETIKGLGNHEIIEKLSEILKSCSEELRYNCTLEPPASKLDSNYLVGNWKDNNSNFTFLSNGAFKLIFNGSSETIYGIWSLDNNSANEQPLLKIQYNGNSPFIYEILKKSENSFMYRTKGSPESTIYIARKL